MISLQLLEKLKKELLDDKESEKEEINEKSSETSSLDEIDKDKLIEQLKENNQMLYKRGILLTFLSIIILMIGFHQSYREGQKAARAEQATISQKVYDTLEDKINDKLNFPFKELLSQFNYFEKYLFDNYEIIDSKMYNEEIVPQIDEFFDVLNLVVDTGVYDYDSIFSQDTESDSNLMAKVYKK